MNSVRKQFPLFLKNIRQLLVVSWKEDKSLFIFYFSTSILGALLVYVVYFVYKLMIDQVTHATALTPALTLSLVIGSYLFFEYLSRFVTFTFNQYYFDYFIRAKLQNALTRLFMEKLATLDFAHLESGEVRNLIAKIENTYATRLPEMLKTVNAIIFNIASLIFSLFIALQFSPKYFLILALVSAPIYYLRAKYGNLAWNAYTENASSTNYLWYIRSLFTNFQTLSEMKIYALRDHFIERTKVLQDKLIEDYKKPIKLYTILSTVSFILIPVAIYFAIRHFITDIVAGRYSIGDFTFFLNALFTFSAQISSLLINVGALFESSLYLNDYFHLQGMENALVTPKKPYHFPDVAPRTIEFQHVTFAYPGSNNPSLKDVNLKIEKGENVAIVGYNGAGKSTLIKLLFRFYDPDEGKILIDGHDLTTLEPGRWYAHIGVLFQDFARYYVSLEDNIRFGRLSKTSEKEVENSLFASKAEDLMKSLPKGLKQMLGKWFEGGQDLSGGQWQKVAIARAIFREAPILILDEPTSAIDADTEAAIFRNLHELYKKRNLLFISHRFSTVRKADRIIVLSRGHVEEQGSHSELMKRNGLYKHLFDLQKSGYEE